MIPMLLNSNISTKPFEQPYSSGHKINSINTDSYLVKLREIPKNK